jgi:hypothetical protein
MRAYARSALSREAHGLASVASGRNNALFDAACRLGKFVHHDFLAVGEVENALIEACHINGYALKDGLLQCRRTIEGGISKSALDPLPILPDRPPKKAS